MLLIDSINDQGMPQQISAKNGTSAPLDSAG